jgi:hypothetical protein
MILTAQFHVLAGTPVALPNATETDVFGNASDGIDPAGGDRCGIALKNLDVSHAIETVTVYRLLGPLTVARTTYGPIGAGLSFFIPITDILEDRIRVTATSSSGASIAAEMRVYRSTR